ncbi:MAG: hypothetical protein HYU51_02345 [Candidatus Rokubacteria bacterium]|nr:hypothetical protein [Candidatus Rokubacteria bacterium]
MTRRRRRRHAGLAATTALALAVAGCARATQVLPVQIDPDPAPTSAGLAVRGYDSGVRAIAYLMVTELRLPLPGQLTVFVYPTRAEYERGLIRDGGLSATGAVRIARASLGLARHRRLFVNDEALRGSPRRAWLSLVAHELAHLTQYELAGGRRGRSEQWLREGMADWVATRILERLGEAGVNTRQRALRAVAAADTDGREPVDLVVLGHPRGWNARLSAIGTAPTYGLALLLTDELVRRHGFDRLIGYFRAFARADDRFGQFRRAFGESLGEFERGALDRIRQEARRAPPAVECDGFSPPDTGPEVPPSGVVEECDRSAVR